MFFHYSHLFNFHIDVEVEVEVRSLLFIYAQNSIRNSRNRVFLLLYFIHKYIQMYIFVFHFHSVTNDFFIHDNVK